NMKKVNITVKDILNPTLNPKKRLVNNKKDLADLVKLLKNNGYKIVLTQGVWDLIHDGHAKYLEKAKTFGDILIVGVDTDKLTKKRKGPTRPVVPENERISMISHLRYVDIITTRTDKEDIGDLIKMIKPDTLVVSKSTKDFTEEMKKDYKDFCGNIINLQPQSTSTTTGRVRQLTIEGAEKLGDRIKKLTDDFIGQIRNGKV
ncbi:MAG: adenylyltransferase/cytidyltransferase family protein, partial [Bacteriovoracia bacterium]